MAAGRNRNRNRPWEGAMLVAIGRHAAARTLLTASADDMR